MFISKFRGRNGITLIALVITIIVLLILAGVTIAMVVGDNGILSRSREAKDTTNIKKIQEEVDLEAADLVAEYHSKDNGEVPSTAGEYVAVQINGKTVNGIEIEADESTMKIIASKDGITVEGIIQSDGHIEWDDENSTVAGGSGTGEQGGSGGESETPTTSPSPSPSPSPVTVSPSNYGQTVNYSTTLNGQTLSNWKVFYQEGNYVWLIYGDYLPNAAVPNSVGLGKSGSYAVNSSTSRSDLITKLTTTSNWSDLINNGSINGTALSTEVKNNTNVKAMGSPTLELYKNSWNAKYPNTESYTTNQLYIAPMATAQSDGLTGYYVSRTNPATTISVQMSGSQGYPAASTADTLYYPHAGSSEWNSTYGFWLASPSAYHAYYVVSVFSDGRVSCNRYDYANFACRPVVCLPSSVVLN